MASDPSFAATPKVGSGLVPGTADTSLTAPTNTTTIVTGGSNGTKIEEIVVEGVGTTLGGLVNIFLYDGTTHHLYDQVAVSAITVSATATAFREVLRYVNLVLPSNTWQLRVANTVAGNVSLLKVTATGGDF